MKSRKLVLGILLGILGLVVSGCIIYAGGVYERPGYGYHHPRYCYDCHYQPAWTAAYVDCDYYDFYFVDKGYYYIPRHHDNRVYVFRKYNYGRDKEFAEYYREHRIDQREREKIDKEYRSVRGDERKRIEREYREQDQKVGKRKR